MTSSADVRRRSLVPLVVGGVLVTLGIAFFVSPLASGDPDGLEKVAIEQGFDESAEDHALGDAAFADYGVRGVDDERLSTGLAGVVGVVITFGVGMIVFGALRRRGEAVAPTTDPEPPR